MKALVVINKKKNKKKFVYYLITENCLVKQIINN